MIGQFEKVVGGFTVELSTSGHPHWTTIKYDQKELHGIHHRDIPDLIYALQKALEFIEENKIGR